MSAKNRGNSQLKRIYYRKQFTGNTYSLTDCNSLGQFPLISDTFSCWFKYDRVAEWGAEDLRTTSRTIPSRRPAWSLLMSILCSLCRRKWSALRLKELNRNSYEGITGEISPREDSAGRNHHKAGALPPAVYTQQHAQFQLRLLHRTDHTCNNKQRFVDSQLEVYVPLVWIVLWSSDLSKQGGQRHQSFG